MLKMSCLKKTTHHVWKTLQKLIERRECEYMGKLEIHRVKRDSREMSQNKGNWKTIQGPLSYSVQINWKI